MSTTATTTTADGVEIAYRVDGEGPPVVLVHGIADDMETFDPLVERLAGTNTCVRLDLRGHGRSALAEVHSSIAMAGDVGAVVEATGVERPTLVGHSLGGMVATVYAAGSDVRAVVNLDQSARLTDFGAALRPLEPSLRGPDFAATFVAVVSALGIDRLPTVHRARVDAKLRAARPEVVLGVWSSIFEADDAALTALVEGLLAEITVPYLAIHGSDPGEGYEAWLTGLVPTARVEVWEGTGHWVHLVAPDRVAAAVRQVSTAA